MSFGGWSLMGWDLDEALQGVHIQVDNDAATSSAIETSGRDIDRGDAGRLARVKYLTSPKRRAGYGLRNDRVRRAA